MPCSLFSPGVFTPLRWLLCVGLVGGMAGCRLDSGESSDVRLWTDPPRLSFSPVTVLEEVQGSFLMINDTSDEVQVTSATVLQGDVSGLHLLELPGDPLLPGSRHAILIGFSPQAPVEVTTEVEVLTDHPDWPRLTVEVYACTVGLSCDEEEGDDDSTPSPGEAHLSWAPASLSFGSVSLGQFTSLELALSSVGSGTLEIQELTVVGDAGFAVSGLVPPAWLAPGEEAVVEVRYEPEDVGEGTAILQVITNDPTLPQAEIPLSGTGEEGCPTCLPDLRVSPEMVDFGDVDSSVWFSLEISNVGTADLNVTGVNYVSNGLSSGGIGADPPSLLLSPGENGTVELEWSPGSLFGDTCLDVLAGGSLEILSNDPDQPVMSLPLGGCCDGSGWGLCGAADVMDVFACVVACADLSCALGCFF